MTVDFLAPPCGRWERVLYHKCTWLGLGTPERPYDPQTFPFFNFFFIAPSLSDVRYQFSSDRARMAAVKEGEHGVCRFGTTEANCIVFFYFLFLPLCLFVVSFPIRFNYLLPLYSRLTRRKRRNCSHVHIGLCIWTISLCELQCTVFFFSSVLANIVCYSWKYFFNMIVAAVFRKL